MRIDMSSVQDVTPVPVAPTGEASITRVNVVSLPTSAPKEASAQVLEPLLGAGIDLTRRVLFILAGVLLIILGNLVYDQIVYSSSTRQAFTTASMANQPAGMAHGLPPQLRVALIPARDTVRRISSDSDPKSTHDALRKTIVELEKLESENKDARSNDELKKLISAFRTLNGAEDTARIDPSAVTPIRQSIENLIDPSTSLVTADTLLAKKELLLAYSASAQATRQFWMEVSQMVLINLLLPVLTALLGYVFASKK